jgi:hypothetical protein
VDWDWGRRFAAEPRLAQVRVLVAERVPGSEPTAAAVTAALLPPLPAVAEASLAVEAAAAADSQRPQQVVAVAEVVATCQPGAAQAAHAAVETV